MQSGNMRGTTRLAREDRFHSRGTALQQCAREARVLEDNSRVFLEYLKTTREFYLSTRRQHTLFCKLWHDRYRTYNEQTNCFLLVYRRLLTNRLHDKAAELCLANSRNNRVTILIPFGK